MSLADYYPYIASLLAGVMLVVAYYVVRHRDLVYASVALALLGSLTAAFTAFLGFGLVAVFIVIVYVGAAVMFIIMSVSMLGGGGPEARNEVAGILAASGILAGLAIVAFSAGLFKAYAHPGAYTVTEVAQVLLSRYSPVLWVLVVALAATLLEAIAVARRGE